MPHQTSSKEVPNFARTAERPFHEAFQQKMLPCPHRQCMNGNCFYFSNGLDHHFRTIHGRPSTMRVEEDAKGMLQVKHSAETLAWIKKTSKMAVRFYRFTVLRHRFIINVCSNLINMHVEMLQSFLFLFYC